ncbi:hypothetical protein [Streptomyces chryseus]|uniref:hypothetical protein n=1 Tax=Streptomyces chryseus TaxID=68186 RepID=UPI001E431A8D|nr:hypothetical protein [Streptomyces chryseus]
MHHTDAVIHCPVRARSSTHARRRVEAAFDRFGLDPAPRADRSPTTPSDSAETPSHRPSNGSCSRRPSPGS